MSNKENCLLRKKELEVRDKEHSREYIRVHMWCNLHREWLICVCCMIICEEKSENSFNVRSENLHCRTLFCGTIGGGEYSNCMRVSLWILLR